MNIKYIYAILAFILLTASPSRATQTATRVQYGSNNPYPFSTNSKNITVWDGKNYAPITIKGINLGIATPGTSPGDLAASKEQYLEWFKDIKAAGYNCIRLYTLHYPVFYQALDSFNTANPKNPLYFIQGVWLEEELTGYNQDLYFISSFFTNEIQEDIDCLHGKRTISQRYGKAYGTYATDVSKWLLAYIIGREVSPDEINTTNTSHLDKTGYTGNYLSIKNVKASEVFITQKLDSLLLYEQQNYQTQRPVAFSSWPTLDPITHPSESIRHTQEDTASLELAGMDFSKAKAGFFVSYHAYPYYPDFVSEDEKYKNATDEEGPNSYKAYLADLKGHYPNIPLLIAEFGVPSSWGVAHYSQSGMNHGGFDELNQGKVDVRLFKTILADSLAGGMQFAWMDEWFKRTWICDKFDFPLENRIMWQNVASAEQNFGMIGFKSNDFSFKPWTTFSNGSSVKSISAGTDFAYFQMQMPLNSSFSDLDTLWVALDTYAATLGEKKLITGETIPNGAEFLLRITNDAADLFVTEAYDLYGIWHGISGSEQLFHSIATNGKPWKLVRWKNNSGTQEIQYIGHLKVNRLNLPPSSMDAVTFKNDTVSIKIPWTLLQFINPAQKLVMHDNRATTNVTEDTISEGIAVSVKYKNQILSTPTRFVWNDWNSFNNVVSYKKAGYYQLQDALGKMDGMYVASPDSFIVMMNSQNAVNTENGVLSNDYLIEDGTSETILTSSTSHGYLNLLADGSFIYIPDVDYYGNDQFSYKVSNGSITSPTTTVNLNIQENNSLIGLVGSYPNPVNDILKVRSLGTINSIVLYNEKGIVMQTKTVQDKNTEINVTGYMPGTYFIKVKVGNDQITQKIIIK